MKVLVFMLVMECDVLSVDVAGPRSHGEEFRFSNFFNWF